MLFLLFSVAERRLCLPVADVERVLPPTSLHPAYGAPPFVSGLLSYQQQWVPVIDLCLLADAIPCSNAMNTRLIVIKLNANSDPQQLIGVIAETVDQTLNIQPDEFSASGLKLLQQTYFGDIAASDFGLLHRLHPGQLLSAKARALISAKPRILS